MYNGVKKEVTVVARTAKTVTVHLKMDEDVKKRIERVCAELGISMSEAFNMFARTLVRERRIPFEVTAEPFYKRNQSAISGRYYGGCEGRQGSLCRACSDRGRQIKQLCKGR